VVTGAEFLEFELSGLRTTEELPWRSKEVPKKEKREFLVFLSAAVKVHLSHYGVGFSLGGI